MKDGTIRMSFSASYLQTTKTHFIQVESGDPTNSDYPIEFKLNHNILGGEEWWEFDEGFAPEPGELEWMGLTEEELIDRLKKLIAGEVGQLEFSEKTE